MTDGAGCAALAHRDDPRTPAGAPAVHLLRHLNTRSSGEYHLCRYDACRE